MNDYAEKSALAERVLEVETQLAFQDVSLEQLDLHVQKLNRIVEDMQVYCSKLEQRLQDVQAQSAEQVLHNDRPPHY